MLDAEEDADLAMAIALSLQDSTPPPAHRAGATSKEAISLLSDSDDDDDDDDDDLDKTGGPARINVRTHEKVELETLSVSLSRNNSTLREHEQKDRPLQEFKVDSRIQQTKSNAPSSNSVPSGIPGIVDRKQMELERLERARKRKPQLSPPSDKTNNALNEGDRRSKRQMTHTDTSINEKDTGMGEEFPDVLSYGQQQINLAPGLQYPNGVVKKTWAYGYPRTDDIKIEEVLQSRDLDLAVLSAFQWDEEWILGKIDLQQSKVICIVQAKDEAEKQMMRNNVPANIKFCFPSMAGNINCMHSKLMILSHADYVRIAVPSANLVPYDWGEDGGIMENTVFIIDLPRLPNKARRNASEMTPFGRELRSFLLAQEMDTTIVDSLLNFDFTSTSHLAFVHSIHSENDWKKTGYCGLGAAVKELGMATESPLKIDFVSASIGSLKNDFIESLYLSAKGDNGLTEYNWRINRPPKRKNAISAPKLDRKEQQLLDEAYANFRIYFPTHETVAASKGGIGSGGTICFQPQWYEADTFPRELMRDCKSVRNGLLMHNKMLFTRLARPIPVPCDNRGSHSSEMETIAWAYVGSANLSESAWGRLVKDRTSKQPKLNIRNWECGVIVPVRRTIIHHDPAIVVGSVKGNESSAATNGGAGESSSLTLGMDVFHGAVPVPMQVPGEAYESRRPWFYTQQR